MKYEVYSDNELSKQIRLLKKTEKTFHVLFTSPFDPKSIDLEDKYYAAHLCPSTQPEYDIIIVDSFNCPSGFTLGSFHVTKTPTLVSFYFNPVFGYSVSEDSWVSEIEQILELV